MKRIFPAVALVLGFACLLAPSLNDLWSQGYAVAVTTGLLFALYTFVSFVLPITYSPATESTGVTSTWPGSYPDGRARPAPALPSVSPRLWPDAGGETAGGLSPRRSPAVTTTAAVFVLPAADGARRSGYGRSLGCAPASRPVSASLVTGRGVSPGGVR